MTDGPGRGSGVLLHITSLPGGPHSGDLGPAAYAFADFLTNAGQRWWQTLPFNPMGNAGSPYSSASSFAGEPLLISPEHLVEDGLLEARALDGVPSSAISWRASFSHARSVRSPLLEAAYHKFSDSRAQRDEFASFCERESAWLDDYCLFGALARRFKTRAWDRWPRQFADRHDDALREARVELRERIDYLAFLQFLFDRQWRALRDYCSDRGVGFIGDLPMFVALDSCDVWANREAFLLDESGRPEFVSGAPPDAFSADGQRWNNPLYDWDYHQQTGFDWWIRRLERQLSLFNRLRLDHFIGFSRYWQIPVDAESARDGQWIPAPGQALLDRLQQSRGAMPFIAEDLGAVTQEVWDLRDRYQLPGMKVLQFAFSDDASRSIHLPDNYPVASVGFTGTHDSDTTLGWYQSLQRLSNEGHHHASEQLAALHAWLGTSDEGAIVPRCIDKLSRSAADTVVFPIQDVLNLDGSHRMNEPGTTSGNWCWRMRAGQLDERVPRWLRDLGQSTGRLSPA
ncbi:MAG: 4-alpha-glucanotransferase [Myxococcota bacterium]